MKPDKPLASIHVIHSIKGRVRLRVPQLKSGSYEPRGLHALLMVQPGIIDVNVNESCRSVTILYDPSVWTLDSLCGWIQGRGREELEEYTAAAALADVVEGESSVSWLQPWEFLNQRQNTLDPKGELQPGQSGNSGYKTVGYASLAVGSVLLPIPLVPGIPFLILSSYCFAKAALSQEAQKPDRDNNIADQKAS